MARYGRDHDGWRGAMRGPQRGYGADYRGAPRRYAAEYDRGHGGWGMTGLYRHMMDDTPRPGPRGAQRAYGGGEFRRGARVPDRQLGPRREPSGWRGRGGYGGRYRYGADYGWIW